MLNKFFSKISGLFGNKKKTSDNNKKTDIKKNSSSQKENQNLQLKKSKTVANKNSEWKNKSTNSISDNKKKFSSKTDYSKKKADNSKKWKMEDFSVLPKEGETRFHDLKIETSIMHAIADLNFKYCTPIQAKVLPETLNGKDAVGKAQTGTGKTAAFLITILNFILKNRKKERKQGFPRALIIAPTRELVLQILKDAQALSKYTRIKSIAVFGGMDYKKQKQMLKSKLADIVIATPGRLLDFKKNNDINLSEVEILVIDEADRMLDMGFIPDVRTIVKSTPFKTKRQTLFFSATINSTVQRLANSWTNNSISVEIDSDNIVAKTIEQKMYLISDEEKYTLLYNLILKNNLSKVLVFCNRRDEAKHIAKRLYENGIDCEQISGEIDQRKRLKTLDDFKSGKTKVLIATDVAGRGIHIKDVSFVVNYNLPENPEDYVHRIGRTGRAGKLGSSIAFASEDDSFNIPDIEKYIGKKFIYSEPDENLLKPVPLPTREKKEDIQVKKNYSKQRRNNYKRKPYGKQNGKPNKSATNNK